MTNTIGEELLATAREIVTADILSPSRHGNMSARVFGEDVLLMVSQSLHRVGEDDLTTLSMNGDVLQGSVTPATAEIIPMHVAIYQAQPATGAVIHTHSPHSTSFAVASRPIEVVSESMARLGIMDAIPVARYGPRGSAEAIQNILEVVREETRAVLLANHGVLVWEKDLASALRVLFALEETAQMSIQATALGGAKPITREMATAARSRREQFEHA